MFFVQYNAQKTYFLHNSEDEITLDLRKGRSNMAITERVEKIRQNYVNTKPHISYERAWSWTKSFQRTEGRTRLSRPKKPLIQSGFFQPAAYAPADLSQLFNAQVA